MTSISFLVPTPSAARPLDRCLNSIAHQLGPKDEVIVIGDTTDGQLPEVERLVESYGPRYRYLACAGVEHTWGHEQLNYGLTFAQGDYVHMNDDDDCWAPDAVETIREGVRSAPGKPHLFRFRHYNGLTYWLQKGLFQRDFIGGHCLVAPNIDGKLGQFGMQYSGDFDMLESTINLHGGLAAVTWHDRIIAIARPGAA